ncbi:MAG: MBL fold metallo-hydrolase [Atopobiaceae bacterium]|nr:MBL fold metallo-hydrolase [Atopobiaceae bacterium]
MADQNEETPNGYPEIRQFVVGQLETNCYVVVSDGEAMVVDPGASGKALAEQLKDVKVTKIVATHGHGDHVGGVKALIKETGAPYGISQTDAERATRANELSSHMGWSYDDDAPEPDFYLNEGDEVSVGSRSFRVINCPGHTPGGVALVGEGIALMGDTIFAGSVGRTDLLGGDYATLMQTLDRLKKELPPETLLLCGHGPVTTMERELATNPYLNM